MVALPVLPCLLRAATGIDCPLCGATRATLRLLAGDLPAALDHNALYVVLLPAVAVVAALWVLRRRQPRLLTLPALRWGLAILAVGFMLVRNLPFGPFPILRSSLGSG